MSKLCPIPFCTPIVFMSVKGITWLSRLGLYDDLLCTTNWYTKFFLVYWLITYIIIFSCGIKWHQNSNVWVDILSHLSSDGFGYGYFLVFLDTIWRTTMTRRSTKITLKVKVLVQMLTILTYVHCVTTIKIYHEDQSHQRSSKGQQRTAKDGK